MPAKSQDDMASQIYQLRITLEDIAPPIWRRIQVSGNATLYRLHLIIQDVMGWENYHLFEFRIRDADYGEPDPEDSWYVVRNARRYKVAQLLKDSVRQFTYTYDLGDNWIHDIRVEAVLARAEGVRYPRILDGARACPPEDCGGSGGYENLLQILADPTHESYMEFRNWVGTEFDPEEFDLETLQGWLHIEHGRESARRR